MGELTRIAAHLSLPIKIGWAVWMIWMICQAVWYRRATTAAAVEASSHRPTVNLAFGGQRTPRKRRTRTPDGPLSVTRPPSDLPEITTI